MNDYMNRTLVKRLACVAALTSLNACVTPRFMRSSCYAASSGATWTATRADGRVEGQVRDVKADDPIGNVEVVLDSGQARQRTDANGNFGFDRVPEGWHLLTTNGTVYLSLRDTLYVLPQGGLKGTIHLAVPRDVLKNCDIYRP